MKGDMSKVTELGAEPGTEPKLSVSGRGVGSIDTRGNSEKKSVLLEEGVLRLKVRGGTRIRVGGEFRLRFPRQTETTQGEQADGTDECFAECKSQEGEGLSH